MTTPWWLSLPLLPLQHILITANIYRELGGVWFPCGDWDGGAYQPTFPPMLLAMEVN